MYTRPRPTEKGQILIILILALIVLLAFTALAVDVGMAFSDRRYDQSVADTAALAGAEKVSAIMRAHDPEINYNTLNDNKACLTDDESEWSVGDEWDAPLWMQGQPTQDVFTAAIERASRNNMTIDKLTDENLDNGVAIRCVDNGRNEAKYIEVKVMVSGVTPTSFAHFIFGGQLRNTVTAVVKVAPLTSFSYGNSILALNNECQGHIGGLDFNGTVNITTYNGGGIFSNQCMTAPGASADVTVCPGESDTPCDCNSMAGAIGYISNNKPINGDVCPAMQRYTEPVPREELNFKGCDEYTEPAKNLTLHSDRTISPGRYSNISAPGSKVNLKMEPGLYCIEDSFNINGGIIESLRLINNTDTAYSSGPCQKTDYACGVTIFMLTNPKAPNQTLTLIGNSGVHLYAPMDDNNLLGIDEPKPKVGLLIGTQDVPEVYTGEVHLGGDSGGEYLGTIFNPYGDLKISGNPSATTPPGFGFTSMIADTITFAGNVTVDVRYDKNLDIFGDAKLNMVK